jgi:hypothetical protein
VTSIDEASGAVGGNAEQARELVTCITASKEIIESLADALAAVGVDAKASQAQAASDRAEELAGHANGLADALDSLRAQIEAMRGLLASSGGSSGGLAPSPLQPQESTRTTRPTLSPDPGRKPGGIPEPVERGSSSENQAAIRGENDAAIVFARSGYDIVQKPPPKPNGKKPDYFMEGDYWDCYTPFTSNPERVRKSLKKKVNPDDGRVQADRIVLNLDVELKGNLTTLTPREIEGFMQRKPLEGLKELKVIRDGRIHDIDLGD